MARHADFPGIQQRLAALGLYSSPIDNEWGRGMRGGINSLLAAEEKRRGIEPPPANLDPRYNWLLSIGTLPRTIQEAMKLLGVVELRGAANSPTIMGWADEIGGKVEDVYRADAIPWCGLFAAVVVQRAGKDVVKDPLWALNWSKFAVDAGQPGLGDIVTFKRNGGGHVGFYIAEDNTHYHVLGGNQSDAVNIMRIRKKRLHRARRPAYRNQPATVKPYKVAPQGRISTNEA